MMRKTLCMFAFVALVAVGDALAAGSLTEQSFFSSALGLERTVMVYLPEEYESSNLDYPVIYLLHGTDGGAGSWYLTKFLPLLDVMIADGMIDPVIIVEPDSLRCGPPPQWQIQGFSDPVFHYHADSELLGNHESYLAVDLVDWVDDHFRTLAVREHRHLLGRSLGGHGAIRLVLRHPEVFGGASIDAGFMAIVEGHLPSQITYVLALTGGPPYEYSPLNDGISAEFFAFSGAFAPNPDAPPWFVNFLLDSDGEIDDNVRQRMVAQSPPALVEEYAGSDYPIDLFLRIGDRDGLSDTFWPVAEALETQELPHLVRVFEGTHDSPAVVTKLAVQLTYLLPLKASAEISPRVADPRLHPQLLRVAVELPGDLDVADIDCSTVVVTGIDGTRLDCPIGCTKTCEVSDLNGNGRNDLSVWLPCDRVASAAFSAGATAGDRIELTIRGELDDGRFFQATDTVTLAREPIANAVTE